MSDPFDALIGPLLKREGGYVADLADPGGETCWGITTAVARKHGYNGPMAALPQDVAKVIYRADYWSGPSFDEIAGHSVSIAAELFDCAVNMGVTTAGMFLQRALNVLNRQGADYPDLSLDGEVGPGTVGALEALLRIRGPAGEKVCLKAMLCLRGAHYIEIAEARPSQERFAFGWLSDRVVGL